MSLYVDFLDKVDADNKLAIQHWSKLSPRAQYETLVFQRLGDIMKRAVIINMRGEQARVFFETEEVAGQDYVQWLRLPFAHCYIHVLEPFRFTGYLGEYDHGGYDDADAKSAYATDPLVRGIVLSTSELARFQSDPVDDDIERVIQVAFLMPLPDFPLNVHTARIFVTKNNHLLGVAGDTDRGLATTGIVTADTLVDWRDGDGFAKTRRKLAIWTIHVINFLNSPGVKLVRVDPAPKLQQSRVKDGKLPLPSYHDIVWRKVLSEYSKDKISTGKKADYAYAFSVRGHQKHFRRGPMAGRVIWCPPFMKAKDRPVFRPKGYKTYGPGSGADPRAQGSTS